MATYGSASNPVTTLTGIDVPDPTNTVYCYIGQTTSFVNCAVNQGMPAVAITSQSNVSNVSFSGGTTWSLSFTLTGSSGSIVLRATQGTVTFNLIGVQAGPTVAGSGTQADPWTRWEGTAWQFWEAVIDGRTYYASIGAYFDVTDYDPRESDEEDYFVTEVQPNGTLGLSIVDYGLSGTVTSSGKVTVLLVWNLEGDEEYKEIYLQLGSGPTLNVKVSGAWKQGKPFVKVNGAWKEATKVYVKVNGAWKESK